MRAKVAKGVIIFLFLLLGLGIVNLGLIHGKRYRDLSNKNCLRLLSQEGCRGKILDREGNVIVDSKLSYDVLIQPQEDYQLDKTLGVVSRILGVSTKTLRETMSKNYFSNSMPVTIASNIELKKAIALEELKIDFPSIIIQPKPLRHYPYSSLASHVIGYVSEIDRWRLTKLEDYGYKTKDIVGFGGLEEKYDYYLRQEEGGLSVQVDHRGRFTRVLGFKPPRNGKDIQLTINLKIQKIVEEKLAGRKGSVIIMDPETGEIIAMASAPSFTPSSFVERKSRALNNLFSDSDAPMMNRAISATYPAGSIFKVIVSTAALEAKKINLSTTFVCAGSAIVGKQEFKCWKVHNEQDLIAAIAHSCNVFFYKTGLLVGAQAIYDYALKFGLHHATGFELPYEASGFIPSPLWRKIYKFKSWYDGDTANLSIGQGEVLVTPIQMARMMAVFANKGYLVTPYIVKGIAGQDISRYQIKKTAFPMKASNIESIRAGLRGVISDSGGTGSVLSSLPVTVAGKTGTAQAPPGQPHAWFVGFLPFEKPKFVMCVLLEHGGPGYYSCVVAKEIIEGLIAEGLI